LLADVLNEDPRIALMVEYPIGRLVGDLLPIFAYEKHIANKFQIPFAGQTPSAAHERFFDPLANGPHLKFPSRYPTLQRLPAIVKGVLEAAFEKSEISIMGSKTPGRWIGTDFEMVKTIFGSPKIVFVVRNPRDTVNSILNRRNLTRAGRDNWQYETAGEAIDAYHEATAQLMSCASEMPDHTFVVGYEDLLADPSDTLRRLGEFLEVDLRDRSGLIKQSNRGKSILTADEERSVDEAFGDALRTWDQKRFTGDGVRAAAMLGDCLMRPVDGFRYRFDASSAPRGFFGAGWSEATSDGMWSDGEVADIWASIPAGRYELLIELAGFVPTPQSPPVRCAMSIGERVAATLTFENMKLLELDFTAVELPHDGAARLSFRFEKLAEAHERGGRADDARHLGICARSFRISRVSEAGAR